MTVFFVQPFYSGFNFAKIVAMSSYTLFLNGKKASKSIIRSMIESFNSTEIRTEKGGYLFKSLVKDKRFYLGVIPSFHQGERGYHYQLEMPSEEGVISGVLNPQGVFTLLMITKAEFTEEIQELYRKNYRALAQVLIENGLEHPGPIDEISVKLITDTGLFPGYPRSLEELLQQ